MLRSYHHWAAFVWGGCCAGEIDVTAGSVAERFLLDFAKLTVLRGVVVAGDGDGNGVEFAWKMLMRKGW